VQDQQQEADGIPSLLEFQKGPQQPVVVLGHVLQQLGRQHNELVQDKEHQECDKAIDRQDQRLRNGTAASAAACLASTDAAGQGHPVEVGDRPTKDVGREKDDRIRVVQLGVGAGAEKEGADDAVGVDRQRIDGRGIVEESHGGKDLLWKSGVCCCVVCEELLLVPRKVEIGEETAERLKRL
jgi:hypothetical protein